jgi:hypothetical protein
MAAGSGFKTFNTGDVLSAADVNGYLMQGVWVFNDAAARDAAVTSPQEGNFAYLKDSNVTTYYTGSAWANLDTTGMTNPMTTTGDTIYSSSGSTPARLGIGTTGQVLTVSGGLPAWSSPASGFPASAESANVSAVEFTTSTSYTDLTTASAVTLTTGTKALVIVSSFVRCNENGQQAFVSYQVSGATSIAASDTFALSQSDYDTNYIGASRASLVTLTAGSNTFTMKFRATGGTARCQTYNRQIFVMNLA